MNKTLVILILLSILLIAFGCASTNIIHVDNNNTAGPWSGTEKHPYKTIKDGVNVTKADSGDIVEVHDGVYSENVVMKSGTTLRQATGTTKATVIVGSPGSPTILAKDRSAIAGLIVDGGSVGVLIELGATISSQKDRWTSVANCRVEGKDGIWIKTPTNLSFGKGIRSKPKINISDNWFLPGIGGGGGGTGIRLDLTGPKSGELSIYLNITGNVIQQKFTGVSLIAKGQGPNPGGFVRAQLTGTIVNNLVFFGQTGIRLSSKNLGSADPIILNNTIADNSSHGIIVLAAAGPDGDASTHPDIVNNIFSGNSGYGYIEFDKKTSATALNHNIFYQNSLGHYFDQETGKGINSQADLNTPIVNNKVVFYGGSGNLVVNPQFVKGNFSWNGVNWGGEKAGEFYLNQSGSKKSPAIDAGLGSAKDAGLHLQSTSPAFSIDTGIVDIGFHYTKPWKP